MSLRQTYQYTLFPSNNNTIARSIKDDKYVWYSKQRKPSPASTNAKNLKENRVRAELGDVWPVVSVVSIFACRIVVSDYHPYCRGLSNAFARMRLVVCYSRLSRISGFDRCSGWRIGGTARIRGCRCIGGRGAASFRCGAIRGGSIQTFELVLIQFIDGYCCCPKDPPGSRQMRQGMKTDWQGNY